MSIPSEYQNKSLQEPLNSSTMLTAMSDSERARTIRLPQRLWDELDRDAIRCMRTSVKQLEALLDFYYRGNRADLSEDQAGNARIGLGATVPPSTKRQNDTPKETTQDEMHPRRKRS